ncbi:hypothetical protein JCM5296_002524 [Sporobolomyces johnsonii]
MSLSSGLTLTDLSDYLAPSQACIKPVTYIPDEEEPFTADPAARPTPAAVAATEIVIGDDSGYYERGQDGERGKKLKKAEITLNDCLACSGCITSAESVLVSLQSHEEVYRVLAEQPELTPIVSISPQSVASLAALYDLSLSDTMLGLRRFFKEHLGFRLVFDTTFPRALSLLESRLELSERRSYAASSSSPAPPPPVAGSAALTPATSPTAPLPILSSACPGWICYAEKTHGALLPFVSGVKSPQAIAGVLIKGPIVAARIGRRPEEIYHVAVMPCYDKKLEASRADFATEQEIEGKKVAVRDVDLVLTTGEVAKMLSDKSLSLRSLALSPSSSSPSPSAVDSSGAEESTFFPFSHLLAPPLGTSSGSYVHTALSSLIRSLPSSSWPDLRMDEKRVRNDDYIEFTLRRTGAGEGGDETVVAKAAKCYGFRNLQNVVRKIGRDAGVSVTKGAAGRAPPAAAGGAAAAANARRAAKLGAGVRGGGKGKEKEKEIEFIEVMACPSGCVNGGGQVAPPKESLRARRRRASWGAEYVGRVDDEGMPDVLEQERERVMEGEVKVVMDTESADGDERVLSAKDWVKEVERRYWSGSSSSPAAADSTAVDVDLSTLHPSIVPYVLSIPSAAEEDAMQSTIEALLSAAGEGAEGEQAKQERRRELMRTSYRAVESEEVNGLAVKW